MWKILTLSTLYLTASITPENIAPNSALDKLLSLFLLSVTSSSRELDSKYSSTEAFLPSMFLTSSRRTILCFSGSGIESNLTTSFPVMHPLSTCLLALGLLNSSRDLSTLITLVSLPKFAKNNCT